MCSSSLSRLTRQDVRQRQEVERQRLARLALVQEGQREALREPQLPGRAGEGRSWRAGTLTTTLAATVADAVRSAREQARQKHHPELERPHGQLRGRRLPEIAVRGESNGAGTIFVAVAA